MRAKGTSINPVILKAMHHAIESSGKQCKLQTKPILDKTPAMAQPRTLNSLSVGIYP